MTGKSKDEEKQEPFEQGLVSGLVRIIGILGGGAVVFYILGFTIVQTFIYRNELEGMFWFTKEFYTDAGAKFLLEMVRAPLLAPHVFLPYACLLFFLVPKRQNLEITTKTKTSNSHGILSAKQWIKVSALIVIMMMTYYIALYFDDLTRNTLVSKIIAALFPKPTNHPSPEIQQSLAFFCIILPIVIVFIVYLHRFYGRLAPGSKSRAMYYVSVITFLLFLTIVPISFGFHLYDWKIVPVREPEMIRNVITKDESQATTVRMWLLGKFGDKYLFFRKLGGETRGILEAFDEDQITYLNFDPKRADSLRAQMEEGFDRMFIEESRNFLNQSLE